MKISRTKSQASESHKGWWGLGLMVVLVLVTAEITYIFTQKPTEYFQLFLNLSMGRFDQAIKSGNDKGSWCWLNKAVYFRGEIVKKDERLKNLMVDYDLSGIKKVFPWSNENWKEEWSKIEAMGEHDSASALAKMLAFLGKEAERTGETESASQLYRAAIAMEPAWGTYKLDWAILEARRGDIDQVKEIIKSCKLIKEAAIDCEKLEQDLAYLEMVAEAREAYRENEVGKMNDRLLKAYDLVMDQETEREQTEQTISFDETTSQNLSQLDWQSLYPVKKASLAKFAYLLGLGLYEHQPEWTGVWLKKARTLAPEWSYFHLEEVNYLLLQGERERAKAVLLACINNPVAGEHCQRYWDNNWQQGKNEPLGNYRGKIENEITNQR